MVCQLCSPFWILLTAWLHSCSVLEPADLTQGRQLDAAHGPGIMAALSKFWMGCEHAMDKRDKQLGPLAMNYCC